jgi:hypothetical protein
LSRGSSPIGYPTKPLVSYQINRQLSGWNLPPLVIRAFGAHCHDRTYRVTFRTSRHIRETTVQQLPNVAAGFPIQVRFSMSGSAQLLLKNASVGEYQRK